MTLLLLHKHRLPFVCVGAWGLSLALGLTGCATGNSVAEDGARVRQTRSLQPDDSSRQEVVSSGRMLLGHKRVVLGKRSYGSDCTSLIRAVFEQVGVNVMSAGMRGDNGVTAMYRFARTRGRIFSQGRPLPGDLVFFRDTYDLNHDGRVNDGLTHVGLVESVDDKGTVSVIHRIRVGVVRYHLNLEHPDLRKDPQSGELLNDYLRAPGVGHALALTGQLFVAYGSVLPLGARVLTDDHLPFLRPQPADGSI